jgi:TonB family protein
MVNDRLDHSAGTRPARRAALLVIVGVSAAIATAQSGVADLSGTVFDTTGRPVPGAAVIIQSDTLDSEMRTHTGPDGHYLFEALPAGDYRLTVTLAGFKAQVVEGIALTGARFEVDDVTLELGSLEEMVFIAGQRGIQTAAGVPRRLVVRPRIGGQEGCLSGEAGGDVKEPRKLTDVRPTYPPDLQAAGVGGVVILEGVVSTSGQIERLRVLRKAHPELDAAAITAVRQWTYSPTLLNCEAVEVLVTVTMNFETR